MRLIEPVDLVLIEGFKRDPLPKIEVYRAANGKPPMHPQDGDIVAVVGDCAPPSAHLPHASIDDIAAAANLVLAHAARLRPFSSGSGVPKPTHPPAKSPEAS